MVTVDKLKINGFGRFNNREFSLSPGLNVVFGGNEAGKSTMHSFIEAMLFGYWMPNIPHRELEPGLEKHRPWQGKNYGGEIEYTWPGGKVRVVRNFADNTVALLDPVTWEKIENIPLNSWGEPDYARLHFGCSKLVFRNTISISQLGSATDSAVAQEVRNLLSNLAQSGGSGISVKQGLDVLSESKRQTDFELMKTRAMLEQVQSRVSEAKRQTSEAARLEIQQYRAVRDLERLSRERRELKEQAGRIQGQAALNKLERLAGLRHRAEAAAKEIADLSHVQIDPATYEKWTDLQASAEKVREVYQIHAAALEEAVQRSKILETQINDLAPYAGFDKDTLIEMSSAWQMQAKGQQVIEEMQSQLDGMGSEIREVTTELAKLPYFRPDALDQAASLQAQARGVEIQGSQDELELELEQQQRSVSSKKTLRLLFILLLPAAAAAAVLLNPLLGLAAVPLLFGAAAANGGIKKAGIRCRNLRREIYTLEMEFVSSQRQREQAQRELSAIYTRVGVESMRELEQKYHAFISLSDRNREILREQQYINGKLEKYYQEVNAKGQELQEILNGVGLGGMAIEQALACFRVNLDKLLDTRVFMEQSRVQEELARQRLEQSRQELDAAEQRLHQMMQDLRVDSPTEVADLADKYSRRLELEQEAATLEQRVQDLLAGDSEAQLRQQAAAASESGGFDAVENIPERLEELEQRILEVQAQKSEGLGRLEGLYSSMPSPADLEEEVWELQEHCRTLEHNLEAIDLASQTIAGLAEELNYQLAPELNQMVSSLVQRITGGKYQDLLVGQDMSISVAAPGSGDQVDLGLLSGGTIDQFYFACRVAIADLVTGGGLPLFLDDSFVQYDDQRLQHMLRLLVELGSSRQIILLTCQQRELEQLAELAPGRYQSINLEN